MTSAVVKCTVELTTDAPKRISQLNAWFNDGVEVQITIPKHVDYKFNQFDEFTSGVLVRTLYDGVFQSAQLTMGLVNFYKLEEGAEYDAVRTPIAPPSGVVLSKLILLQDYLPTTTEFPISLNHSIVHWFRQAVWGVSGHRVSLLINSAPVVENHPNWGVTGWSEVAVWGFYPQGHHEIVSMSRNVDRLMEQLNVNFVIDPLDSILPSHLAPDEYKSNQELIVENFDWFLYQLRKEPLLTMQYLSPTKCVIDIHDRKAQVPNVGAHQSRQYVAVYPDTHAGKYVISQPSL